MAKKSKRPGKRKRTAGSLKRVVRRWVALHSAYSSQEEYDKGWRWVQNRQQISLYIKVRGIENAKWIAKQLNKAESPNDALSEGAGK